MLILVLLCSVWTWTRSQRLDQDSWTHQGALSQGLCHYGNSLECCFGWTRLDWGRCQPLCQQGCKHGDCVAPDRCKCHPGYTGKACNHDLNECGLKPRPCKHRCMNTPGSFKCYCLDGFAAQPDGSCRNARTCYHANCQYGCEVIKGSVRCTCPSPGLRLGPDRRTCVDIDECVSGGGVCPRRRKCVNTFGSYMCKCHLGFKLTYINGRYTCIDKDPRPFCALNPTSPKCRCKDGSCAVVKVTVEPPRPRITSTTPSTTTSTRTTTTTEATPTTTALQIKTTTMAPTTPTTFTTAAITTTITTPSTTTTTASTTTTTAITSPTPATPLPTTTIPPSTTTTTATTTTAATTVPTTTATTPLPTMSELDTSSPPTPPPTTSPTLTTPPPTTTTSASATTAATTPPPPPPTTAAAATTAPSTTTLVTTTVNNRVNKEVTQRQRGDVHIPRHPGHNQVWEFDIELGNTAEDARDDPEAAVLRCTFDRGLCSWMSDREGDLHWEVDQDSAGGRYLSVAELKAGQRSVRGARLAIQVAPPWRRGNLCFSFSHWLTGYHVGVMQLFVRRGDRRYSPAHWSRTGGHGWRRTEVSLTTASLEQVLLKAERRRGRRGQMAVDDVTLRQGPCR